MENSTFDKDALNIEKLDQLQQVVKRRLKDQTTLLTSMEETLQDLAFQTTYGNNISKMVTSITHEVRNPLTTVKGFLQLMKQCSSDQTLLDYIDISLNEITRASDLLTEFLDCSKNHEQTVEIYDVKDVLKELFPIITAKANLSNVQIEMLITENILSTLGEKNKLKQVLINIINNSLESFHTNLTTANRMIEITTETWLDNIIITIKDNGMGMNEETLNHLFQPLQTSKKDGNGMGLFLCRKIIEKANGSIIINSTLHVGTTVKLFLPFKNMKVAEE